MKNPLTLAGIEPATFRFVAQHLNHCATAIPITVEYLIQISLKLQRYHTDSMSVSAYYSNTFGIHQRRIIVVA